MVFLYKVQKKRKENAKSQNESREGERKVKKERRIC